MLQKYTRINVATSNKMPLNNCSDADTISIKLLEAENQQQTQRKGTEGCTTDWVPQFSEKWNKAWSELGMGAGKRTSGSSVPFGVPSQNGW